MFIYLSACVLSFLSTPVEGAPSPRSSDEKERCTFVDELNYDGTKKQCIFPFTDKEGRKYLNCKYEERIFSYSCPTQIIRGSGQETTYSDFRSCDEAEKCGIEGSEYCTMNADFNEHNKDVFESFGQWTKVDGNIAEVSLVIWKKVKKGSENLQLQVQCPPGWFFNKKLPKKYSTHAAPCDSGEDEDRSIHVLGCYEKCEDLNAEHCTSLLEAFGVENVSIDQDYCSKVTSPDMCEHDKVKNTCCPKACNSCDKVPVEMIKHHGDEEEQGNEGLGRKVPGEMIKHHGDEEERGNGGLGRNGAPSMSMGGVTLMSLGCAIMTLV